MLSEIAAEALRFLSRRDLDKACAVSKWLDAMIAKCCDIYPFRPVLEVALLPCGKDFGLNILIEEDDSQIDRSFDSMDGAAQFLGLVLRHSYVQCLQLGDFEIAVGSMTLSPDHWRTLVDAVRGGAVRDIEFNGVDLSAIVHDALEIAFSCPGLQSLEVQRSVVPNGFVSDELLYACGPKGLLQVLSFQNTSNTTPRFSEDAILDFFFSTNVLPEERKRYLALEGSGVTDVFVSKFFERLRSSSMRSSHGSVLLFGATKQHGLSTYAQYLAPEGMHGNTYRFPMIDEDKSYEVKLLESSSSMLVLFRVM